MADIGSIRLLSLVTKESFRKKFSNIGIYFVKFLFKFSIGFIVLICVFYFIFLSERNKSLENDPAVKQWIGKDFEIKKGVYILKYDDDRSGRHHLVLPYNTNFPASVEEFLEDTEAWFYCARAWYRPLMPGSHFRILKIFKH